MLAQAEQAIQAKIPPAMQANFEKVVHAGLTILYSPKLAQQRNAQLANVTDPAQLAGQGAARMVSNLFQQSGKKIPIPLIIPAAMVLAFEFLDLAAKAGKAQITPDLIAKATQAVADAILPLFGATKDKVAQMTAQKAGAPAAPAPAPAGGIIGNAQAGA